MMFIIFIRTIFKEWIIPRWYGLVRGHKYRRCKPRCIFRSIWTKCNSIRRIISIILIIHLRECHHYHTEHGYHNHTHHIAHCERPHCRTLAYSCNCLKELSHVHNKWWKLTVCLHTHSTDAMHLHCIASLQNYDIVCNKAHLPLRDLLLSFLLYYWFNAIFP